MTLKNKNMCLLPIMKKKRTLFVLKMIKSTSAMEGCYLLQIICLFRSESSWETSSRQTKQIKAWLRYNYHFPLTLKQLAGQW